MYLVEMRRSFALQKSEISSVSCSLLSVENIKNVSTRRSDTCSSCGNYSKEGVSIIISSLHTPSKILFITSRNEKSTKIVLK